MPNSQRSMVLAAVLVANGIGAVEVANACERPNALGVSRTITIDPSGGKLYGGLQYRSADLLKDREVILTFDDGPLRRYTKKVLEALASHCAKATFFMVGRMAVSDPQMVREVAAAGHTIANHTWSHKNLQRSKARRAGGEIELGISAVRIAAKEPISPFFRFPYLADPKSMLAYGKTRGLAIFSIDIDAYDYKTKSEQKVFANIMGQLRARRKGIMLFHDIQRSTAFAMQRVLDTMQREGYKIVHVVSKTPVKTLSNFDADALKIHKKRRTVARAKLIEPGAYEKAKSVKRKSSNKTKSSGKDVGKTASKDIAKTKSESQPAKVEAKVRQPRVSGIAILPPQKLISAYGVKETVAAHPRLVARPTADWRKSVWGK